MSKCIKIRAKCAFVAITCVYTLKWTDNINQLFVVSVELYSIASAQVQVSCWVEINSWDDTGDEFKEYK
jgi:hypothetical protein